MPFFSKKWSAFIFHLLIWIGFLCLIQVVYLYKKDPFRIFEWPDGDSVLSVNLFHHMRFHKVYRLNSVRPEQLIFGSSRSARISPDAIFSPSDGSMFNASIPGATLYEIRRTLEHSLELASVKKVLLGLDQSMYRPGKALYRFGFREDRFLRAGMTPWDYALYYRMYFMDLWHVLLNRNTLALALGELSGTSKVSPRIYGSDGTWSVPHTKKRSRQLSGMVARNEFQRQLDMTGEPDFVELGKILDLLEEFDVDVTIILLPLHARTLVSVELAGGLERYVKDQRALLDFVGLYSQVNAITVVGMEHNAAIVNTAITSEDSWFEDGIHLRRDSAAQIANCLSNGMPSGCPDGVGLAHLEATVFEEYSAAIRANLLAYKNANKVEYSLMKASLARD